MNNRAAPTAHARHAGLSSLNRITAVATAHCLTGCAIGEVLGMVIGTALGWGAIATIALAIALAFFSPLFWGSLAFALAVAYQRLSR